jgi:hypothetical protein
MASPQIAALAEYLWSIAPDLSAPQIVHVIRATARPAQACQSAPAADGYAAVLSLDHPGPPTPANDPVRLALFDVNNDHSFDEHDLMGRRQRVSQHAPEHPGLVT